MFTVCISAPASVCSCTATLSYSGLCRCFKTVSESSFVSAAPGVIGKLYMNDYDIVKIYVDMCLAWSFFTLCTVQFAVIFGYLCVSNS